ncbi:unnamed protein product [Cyprideis torosa]|uniref:Uncharacterized protein n=1 Tax=Cyprideis torosa TaxID=163714 RepID=A0A7R8WGE8_9CRUS|nr:unnamed protein product [Cyprideis torosa]CAG0891650.1 unnamed protein product [Cyprideis torosa]
MRDLIRRMAREEKELRQGMTSRRSELMHAQVDPWQDLEIEYKISSNYTVQVPTLFTEHDRNRKIFGSSKRGGSFASRLPRRLPVCSLPPGWMDAMGTDKPGVSTAPLISLLSLPYETGCCCQKERVDTCAGRTPEAENHFLRLGLLIRKRLHTGTWKTEMEWIPSFLSPDGFLMITVIVSHATSPVPCFLFRKTFSNRTDVLFTVSNLASILASILN